MITRNPHRAFEGKPVAQTALPKPSGKFTDDFLHVVSWCIDNCNNHRSPREVFHLPPEPYLLDAARALGDRPKKSEIVAYAESIVRDAINNWEWLYSRLEDRDSKATLLDVLAYRTIGWRHVKLPLDNTNFWGCLELLGHLEAKSPRVQFNHGLSFAKMDLTNLGYGVTVFSSAFGVFNEFIYSQYQYRGRRSVLGPRSGDYVLDCGACFGGTSLYFADMVGAEGQVISFEFFPGNIDVFKRNVRENLILASRIKLHEAPLWLEGGLPMFIEFDGPAAQVYQAEKSRTGNDLQVISTTLDAACEDLPRVDFIKEDIEGAELYALVGGQRVLRNFKPTLAICVYHKLFDFWEIPQWLDNLNLGYRFFLQHASIHGDETVLFADARGCR